MLQVRSYCTNLDLIFPTSWGNFKRPKRVGQFGMINPGALKQSFNGSFQTGQRASYLLPLLLSLCGIIKILMLGNMPVTIHTERAGEPDDSRGGRQ